MRLCTTILGMLLAGACFAVQGRNLIETAPIRNGGLVAVDTYKGSITVSTWDSPTVEVSAEVDGPGGTGRDAQVHVESSPDGIRIRSDYGAVWTDSEDTIPSVHYCIRMPKSARLDIKDYDSMIAVSGLKSEVNVETYKGTGTISDLDGALHLKTYRGDVRVQFRHVGDGTRLETYRGNIDVAVPKAGPVRLDSSVGKEARLESSMDPSTAHRGPLVHLKTFRGVVRLRTF